MKKYIRNISINKTINKSAPAAEFELSEKQIERLQRAGEVMFALTLTAGVISLTVLAPNIFTALDRIFGKKQYGSRRQTLERRKKQLARKFYYLRDQGYIEITESGNLLYCRPTKKGLKKLAKFQFENMRVPTPKRWNKTWWIVIADVPQEFRYNADQFRDALKAIDFYPLQRTVWIYPHDPRNEVEALAAGHNISSFVTMMEVNRLDESDEKLVNDIFKNKQII